MSDKSNLEQEELKILNDEGYKFKITYKNKRNILNHFFIKKNNIVEEELEIEPLRLSTMDRIAKYQSKLKLDIDKLLNDEEYLSEANYLIKENTSLLIDIVSIAVVGSDYSKIKFKNVRNKIAKGITVSMLYEITQKLLQYQDHANFINSTRLMIARSTIKPNEVEKEQA